jgi:hypothetical protein
MPDERTPSARDGIARTGIGLALFMGLFGLFATMHPVFAMIWFGVAAALALVGAVSPRRREVAVFLAALLAVGVWGSYREGVRYEEWKRQNPLPQRVP